MEELVLLLKFQFIKTTGLVWPGPGKELPRDIDEVMKLNFESEPGMLFKYKPDPQIIVYLLEAVYQCSIIELFNSKLVKYFKNKEYIWNRGTIQDMQITIGMLDELGQLMLHRGMIYGNILFSEEYYNECIIKYSNGGFPENAAYGLGWWLDKINDYTIIYAAGFGGQRTLIIPRKKICMSIISDMDRPHPEYKEIVEVFYNNMTSDLENYKVSGTTTKKCSNFFIVSCLPWLNYSSFTASNESGYQFIFPMVTWGKYITCDNKIIIPLTLQIHHAVADGYHCSLFYNDIEQIIMNPEKYLK